MSFEVEIVTDLAVLLAVSSIVTFIFYKLKQPLIVGYLLSGILVGPYLFPFKIIAHPDVISVFAQIGIILLLFSIGLEFPLTKLRALGKVVLSVGAIEISFTVSASLLIGTALHWPFYDTLFLGAALASSSTTIVAKVLSDLGKIKEIPARIMLGMLVVEDVFVVLLLAVLHNLVVTQSFSTQELLFLLLKLAVFVGSTLGLGFLLIRRLAKKTTTEINHEVLYIALLGLSFVFAAAGTFLGFSIALGAFLIGVVLAGTHINEEISKEFVHLRHLFEAIFFVSMGTLMDFTQIGTYWLSAILVILALMAAKFSSCALGVKLFGYDRKTSAKVALGMAQIGEFAFIVAKTGKDLGVISPFFLPIIGISAIVTSIVTPYLLKYAYGETNK
jgi:monovalent cation:H+ antiporter-2, CPA2 family